MVSRSSCTTPRFQPPSHQSKREESATGKASQGISRKHGSMIVPLPSCKKKKKPQEIPSERDNTGRPPDPAEFWGSGSYCTTSCASRPYAPQKRVVSWPPVGVGGVGGWLA